MSTAARGVALCLTCLLTILCLSRASAQTPENLRYPKSRSFGGQVDTEKPFLTTKTTKVMGTEILMTPDAFEKVLAFYEKQFGHKLGSDSTETAGLTSAELVEGFISNDDSKMGVGRDEGQKEVFPPRDVRLVTLTKVDKERVTTVILSRAKSDKRTHIVVTWVKR